MVKLKFFLLFLIISSWLLASSESSIEMTWLQGSRFEYAKAFKNLSALSCGGDLYTLWKVCRETQLCFVAENSSKKTWHKAQKQAENKFKISAKPLDEPLQKECKHLKRVFEGKTKPSTSSQQSPLPNELRRAESPLHIPPNTLELWASTQRAPGGRSPSRTPASVLMREVPVLSSSVSREQPLKFSPPPSLPSTKNDDEEAGGEPQNKSAIIFLPTDEDTKEYVDPDDYIIKDGSVVSARVAPSTRNNDDEQKKIDQPKSGKKVANLLVVSSLDSEGQNPFNLPSDSTQESSEKNGGLPPRLPPPNSCSSLPATSIGGVSPLMIESGVQSTVARQQINREQKTVGTSTIPESDIPEKLGKIDWNLMRTDLKDLVCKYKKTTLLFNFGIALLIASIHDFQASIKSFPSSSREKVVEYCKSLKDNLIAAVVNPKMSFKERKLFSLLLWTLLVAEGGLVTRDFLK